MNILAFDIGTSAIKASLVSFTGVLIDSAFYEYGLSNSNESWVEQNPADWWEGARIVSKILFERNPGLQKKIAGIGVCGHMLGCIPVDSKGNALRHAIIHADTRANLETEYIANVIGRDNIYKRTGSILSSQSSLSKILWLKKNEPEVYSKTVRFLQSKDYLIAKLTGDIDSTDFSDASHAVIMDIHSMAYMNDVFKELSLDVEKFPVLYKGTEVAGKVTEEAARQLNIISGIPVIAGGGDGACANIGAGITTNGGEVYGNMGTTAWLAYNSAVPVIDEKSRIFNIVSLDGESFGIFGTIQAAGKSVDWAKKLFNIENSKIFDEKAALASPGSNGLIFLPYIDGERAPIFDANARGLFFNINSSHQQIHFIRSVLEGVSFALRSILDVFRERNGVSNIRMIGGGAKSKLWMQILADVFDAHILTAWSQADSVTSLGVALAAGVGIGVYKNLDEASANIKVSETIAPLRNNVSMYNHLFAKYTNLYPRLKSLFACNVSDVCDIPAAP
jgi:xylulokinase